MARQGVIARYLGLTLSSERALADAFVRVGVRHAAEPEMRNAARLYSNWGNERLGMLRPPAERYGTKRSREGERLRRALFRGLRVGEIGRLRDLHDLLILATSVHACWMALLQAAREERDRDLEALCRSCKAEIMRQISWLETKLRLAAPQALTVPPATRYELAAAIPTRQQIAAIADLIPGPALRGLAAPAPFAAVFVMLAALFLFASRGRPPGG
jgi:hypothetical protein